MEAPEYPEGVVLLLGYGDQLKLSSFPNAIITTSHEEISPNLGGEPVEEKAYESTPKKDVGEEWLSPFLPQKRKRHADDPVTPPFSPLKVRPHRQNTPIN